ncbi:hypothetical protein L917_17884 [Phytophthora nicotianae]|uniref:N-acetyltransferase domain-containing protein n=2 Tax=Phytophthora nicotianae TaxID=4792 RepID=W2K9F2_PHYNI|nr:hypothetical protein L917_17884 [Phytophthora nicotianae]ETO63669.1 hypothetical protein F444_18679 [Phytophthora nicotianae P1976]
MPLKVTIATKREDKQLAYDLRLRVFCDEEGHTPSLQVDEHDDEDSTIHFIGVDTDNQDKVIAVARCMVDERNRQARIGRVALLPQCRGKGYGKVLMDVVEETVQDRVESFILLAQLSKQGFYEKCGYRRKDDEVFLDEHIKVCWMLKKVAAN